MRTFFESNYVGIKVFKKKSFGNTKQTSLVDNEL